MEKLKMTDRYYGQPCKILFVGQDLSQKKEIEIREKYPEYDIKEIGYQGDVGYVYKIAAFER